MAFFGFAPPIDFEVWGGAAPLPNDDLKLASLVAPKPKVGGIKSGIFGPFSER